LKAHNMVQKTVLDNGIRVISERMPVHSVSIGIWVETGSRHETAVQNGIAHFFEHMLFKGTEHRTALDIAKAIDSVGGILNAFTNREFSCFYAKILAEQLPFAVELLGDILLRSRFDPDEVEKERRVILQEIHMVEDAPEDQVHDLFCSTFWPDHSLGRPVLGTEGTVGRIERDHLTNFHHTHVVSRNIVVCASGDLDHQAFAELVAGAFSDIPRGTRPGETISPTCHRSIALIDRELEQAHICLGTRALPQNHPDRFEMFLLSGILGGSMSSRLFQKVREEAGLAYSIYSYLNCHSDTGALIVYAGTAPDDSPEVVRLILRELRRMKEEPIGDEELTATKNQLKGNLLLSLESTDNRMTRIAKNEIYLGRDQTIEAILASIDKVSSEKIRILANSLFKDECLALQIIGQVDSKDFPAVDLTLE